MPSSGPQPPASPDPDRERDADAHPDQDRVAGIGTDPDRVMEEDLTPNGPWRPPPLLRSTLSTLRLHSGAAAACVWMETSGGLSLVAADPTDLPLGEVVPHPGAEVLEVLDRGALHFVEVDPGDPAIPSLPMLHDRVGASHVAVLPIRPVGAEPPAAVALYLRDRPERIDDRLFEWGRWARLLGPVLPHVEEVDSSGGPPPGGLVEHTPQNVRTITRDMARRLAAQLATVEAALGQARRLEEHPTPYSRFLEHALEGLDRTRELLARLELFADDELPVSEVVSVAECLQMAVRRLESERPDRVRLNTSAPATLPPVAADRLQLSGALEEVIRNALEAAPAGTDVTARIEPSGGWVCIEVTDQGKGMSREEIERAALPFYSTKSRAGHNGLGLTTAEGIVRRHGGRVSVSSQVGRGTTVRLWLPASAPDRR
jgi:signal transduction histidine kinase